MPKSSRFLSVLILIFVTSLIYTCGIIEPESKNGSLIIVLNQPDPNPLSKSLGELDAVQCIVKKGATTKYDQNLTKNGGYFEGDITELDPGNDYSVLLYGKNISNDIIRRGYQDQITVNAGKATTVNINWDEFTVTLVAPVDGSTSKDQTPAFDWNDVPGAALYELLVDNSSDFDSPVIGQNSLTSSNYLAPNPLADGSYYWKVRAKDSQGNWSGWSDTWSFSINQQLLAAPTQLLPANASVITDNQPTFDWDDVTDAAKYELLVAKTSDFSSPEIQQSALTSSNYTAANSLTEDSYYWKVRAQDSQDNWGAWSDSWTFTITAPPPAVPTLISPANESVIGNTSPDFDWNDVTNAVKYELMVDQTADFSSPAIQQSALTSSDYTATSSLSDGVYYWKVRAQDANSNWSDWSSSFIFTIDTRGPAEPTLVSPADNATISDNTPDFDWNEVSDAVSYELWVDNTADFTSPEIQQNRLTSSDYTATSSLSDDTYYWKVRCQDNLGNWNGWSDNWSFTISHHHQLI